MTKEEIKTKITAVSDSKVKEANSLSDLAILILILGCVGGAIMIFADLFAYGYLFITGIVYIFFNWIIYVALNGVSAIIANTYKTMEYTKLRVEILAEGTTEETYDDSLPTL